MASIESVLNWFVARQGKVTYSMNSRLGPKSYDCSSAVYFSLIEAGFLPKGTGIGNTETLYSLEGSLLQRISRKEAQRGDIFISGGKGTSSGANGHTGIFVNNSRIIHCNYGSNGISETSTEGGWMGGPPTDCYRLRGATPEQTKKEEGFLMWVFYQANNNVPVRWFNGEHSYPLAHPDERNAINHIYKANTGKDVPFLTNWKDASPYHNRLANVLNRRADF